MMSKKYFFWHSAGFFQLYLKISLLCFDYFVRWFFTRSQWGIDPLLKKNIYLTSNIFRVLEKLSLNIDILKITKKITTKQKDFFHSLIIIIFIFEALCIMYISIFSSLLEMKRQLRARVTKCLLLHWSISKRTAWSRATAITLRWRERMGWGCRMGGEEFCGEVQRCSTEVLLGEVAWRGEDGACCHGKV